MRRCISTRTPTTTARSSTPIVISLRIKMTSPPSWRIATRAAHSICCCGRKIGRRSPRPPITGLSISSPVRGEDRTRNTGWCWPLCYPDAIRTGRMAKKQMHTETLQLRNTARRNREEQVMASDRLFAEKKDPVGNFAFDRDTALVFDDVLNRSVPFYTETQRMIGEIAQKREALENVLILYQLWENEELLQRAGFRSVDVFFKWYNFCGMLALK